MDEGSSHPARGRIGEYVRRVARGDDPHRAEAAARPPRKLYRVSEIAQHLDLSRQTVHNYATIGLITEEARTPGGQRLFGEAVFERLGRIQHLKHEYRLHEIRRLLETDAAPSDAAEASDARTPPAEGAPSS